MVADYEDLYRRPSPGRRRGRSPRHERSPSRAPVAGRAARRRGRAASVRSPWRRRSATPRMACTHERLAEHALVLKHDRLFMLVIRTATSRRPALCSLGLFQDDTRILSQYALSVHGGPPDPPLGPGPQRVRRADRPRGQRSALRRDRWDPRNVVHIRRELALADRLVERVTLTGYLGTPERLLDRARPRLRLRRHLRGARAGDGESEDSTTRPSRWATPWSSPIAAATGALLRTRGALPPAARPAHRAERAMGPAARGRAAGRARVGGLRRRGRRPAGLPARGLDDCRNSLDHVYRGWHEGNSRGRRTSTTSTRCSTARPTTSGRSTSRWTARR